jgi:hypothetical protein
MVPSARLVTSAGKMAARGLGYFEEFPNYLTQGDTVEELEENLRDLTGGEIRGIRRVAQLTVG